MYMTESIIMVLHEIKEMIKLGKIILMIDLENLLGIHLKFTQRKLEIEANRKIINELYEMC